jgi:hypothetical protein
MMALARKNWLSKVWRRDWGAVKPSNKALTGRRLLLQPALAVPGAHRRARQQLRRQAGILYALCEWRHLFVKLP